MKKSEAIRILGDTTLCTPLGQAAFVGIAAIKEVQQYQAIGTVEECRKAREKQRAKKIIHNPYGGIDEDWLCPSCGKFCNPYHKFCTNCGQKVECDNE